MRAEAFGKDWLGTVIVGHTKMDERMDERMDEKVSRDLMTGFMVKEAGEEGEMC